MQARVIVGTAGWSVPRASAGRCPTAGSHLQRYARVFGGTEINSSFYRPHASPTYARWAAATPPHFRFAVKVPRAITHEQALRRPRQPFREFLDQIRGLGEKCGPLLVQLPPSHAFDARVVGRFLATVRGMYDGPLVCEPRHGTWFTPGADRLLDGFRVARVAADPPRAPGDGVPGGWQGLVYCRWHGAPRMYWSRYDAAAIARLAAVLLARQPGSDAWCIFDNTASGAALENAFELQHALAVSRLHDGGRGPDLGLGA